MECYRFGTFFFRKYIQHLLKKGDIRWSNKEICWSNNDMCLFDQLIRPARAAFAPLSPSQNTGQSEKNIFRTCRKTQIFIRLLTLEGVPNGVLLANMHAQVLPESRPGGQDACLGQQKYLQKYGICLQKNGNF